MNNNKLSITNDFLFKEFFKYQDKNGELIFLKSLVESLLGHPVDKVTLKPTEVNGDNIDAKDIRLDLLVKVNDDKIIDLEMQSSSGMREITARSAVYASQIFLDQNSKGINYSQYNETHVVFFMAKNMFEENSYHNHFMYRNEEGRALTKLLNIHMIEVLKSMENLQEISKIDMLQKWSIFCNYREGTTNEVILSVIESEDILKEGVKVFEELTQDEIMKDRAFARQKWERDVAQIRYEGVQEGLEQGLELGIKVIVNNLLDLNYPIEEISKVTGLSSDGINQLKANK